MNKSLSMIYMEFKYKLSDLINNSGLPMVVIESVLQNYLSDVSNIVRNQYLLDKEKFEKLSEPTDDYEGKNTNS